MKGVQVSNISGILWDILCNRQKVDNEAALLSCLPVLTEKTLKTYIKELPYK